MSKFISENCPTMSNLLASHNRQTAGFCGSAPAMAKKELEARRASIKNRITSLRSIPIGFDSIPSCLASAIISLESWNPSGLEPEDVVECERVLAKLREDLCIFLKRSTLDTLSRKRGQEVRDSNGGHGQAEFLQSGKDSKFSTVEEVHPSLLSRKDRKRAILAAKLSRDPNAVANSRQLDQELEQFLSRLLDEPAWMRKA